MVVFHCYVRFQECRWCYNNHCPPQLCRHMNHQTISHLLHKNRIGIDRPQEWGSWPRNMGSWAPKFMGEFSARSLGSRSCDERCERSIFLLPSYLGRCWSTLALESQHFWSPAWQAIGIKSTIFENSTRLVPTINNQIGIKFNHFINTSAIIEMLSS